MAGALSPKSFEYRPDEAARPRLEPWQRKELATELGYTGELNGSAEMNIWLQKAVMKELEKNGGKVPAGLKD